MKYDLSRITELCHALGHPHKSYPVIHVAGTNGKGSVSHMLASVLQSNGLRVGLHTSPHYRDFRERIKVNGEWISKDRVMQFVERIQFCMHSLSPSFFEMSVAMAFDHFRSQQVDMAVIETGLGGRLDSTNIVDPILSVITNISFDHQEFLGNTLEAIAGEKAGIIKRNKPVVVGNAAGSVRKVFEEKSMNCQSSIYFAQDRFSIKVERDGQRELTYQLNDRLSIWDGRTIQVPNRGPFQAENIVTVLQAFEVLRPILNCTLDSFGNGLRDLVSQTHFVGRWQWLSENPLILTDSAHNEGGMTYVVDFLRGHPGGLRIVLGMVKDKDIGKMLTMLPKEATYYFVRPKVPRGLAAVDLQTQAKQLGLKGKVYDSVAAGLQAAKKEYLNDELIFVGGSSFVVAEVV